MTDTSSDREQLWKTYTLNLELFKFYLKLVLVLNALSCVAYSPIMLGGITRNVFGVWFLILLAVTVAVVTAIAAPYASLFRRDILRLSEKLEIDMVHSLWPLHVFLRLSYCFHGFAAIFLFLSIFY